MVSGVKKKKDNMNQLSIPAPNKLNVSDGNRSKNFDIFNQAWRNFEIATQLIEKGEEIRLPTLLSIIGQEALEIYNTFEWRENELKSVENTLLKFETFCKPKKNVTYERFILLTRKQNADENIDDFVKDLRILADTCEFGSLKSSIIKDAFVLGINDNRVRENLLKDPELTLETAVNIARASEKAREQASRICDRDVTNIMKVQHNSNDDKLYLTKNCKYCGGEHKMKKSLCPAFGKKCDKCGLMNHFSRKCKTKNVRSVNDANDNSNDEEYYIE